MAIQKRLAPKYPKAKYSFDTDVYISIWRYYYPRDVFITLWREIERMIQEGVILSTYTVKVEISRQKDEIYEYFR